MRRIVLLFTLGLAADASADDVLEERADPRLRAGLSAVLSGGFGGSAAAIGPGLAGDLGFLVEDRVSLGLRASFGTSVLLSIGSAGLFVEYALNDHANVGLGAALTAFHPFAEDLASAVAVLFPLRADLSLASRDATMRARQGWSLTVELSPGVAFGGSSGLVPPGEPVQRFPSFAMAATAGVGYVWF